MHGLIQLPGQFSKQRRLCQTYSGTRLSLWQSIPEVIYLFGLLGGEDSGLGGGGTAGLGGGEGDGLLPVLGGAPSPSSLTAGSLLVSLRGGMLLLNNLKGLFFTRVVEGLVKRDIDLAENEDLHVFQISQSPSCFRFRD